MHASVDYTKERDVAKPLPTISDFNRPFWEGTRLGEFRLQHCNSCGKVWAPNGPVCPHCFSEDYRWDRMSGKGKIVTWVVFHKLYHPSFARELPYNVAFIQLDEGPRVIANVVGISNEKLKIGIPAEAVFDKVNDEVTIPRFRLLKR